MKKLAALILLDLAMALAIGAAIASDPPHHRVCVHTTDDAKLTAGRCAHHATLDEDGFVILNK